MEAELKPCPFCGGKAILECEEEMGIGPEWLVVCLGCHMEGAWFSSKAKATEAWNTRVA